MLKEHCFGDLFILINNIESKIGGGFMGQSFLLNSALAQNTTGGLRLNVNQNSWITIPSDVNNELKNKYWCFQRKKAENLCSPFDSVAAEDVTAVSR